MHLLQCGGVLVVENDTNNDKRDCIIVLGHHTHTAPINRARCSEVLVDDFSCAVTRAWKSLVGHCSLSTLNFLILCILVRKSRKKNLRHNTMARATPIGETSLTQQKTCKSEKTTNSFKSTEHCASSNKNFLCSVS